MPENKQVTTLALSDGNPFILRAVRPEDAADLVEIQRQVVEENAANVDDHVDTVDECRARIASINVADLWLVAEGSLGVIGSIRLIAPGPSFLKHLRNLFIDVHQKWRSRGVGVALIMRAVTWARANGVDTIALSVLDSNPRARALYERIGFQVTGHTPNLVQRPDGTSTGDTQMILRLNGEDELER